MSGNHRIVIVDDEPDLLKMIEIYLKKWQFEVSAFSDPVEALEHFQDSLSEYSLVITDVRMPKMTGLELANRLLRIKPDIKIMLMTAFEISGMELQSNLPVIQHKDILKKPFRLVEICEGVKKQLQVAN